MKVVTFPLKIFHENHYCPVEKYDLTLKQVKLAVKSTANSQIQHKLAGDLTNSISMKSNERK